MEKTKTVFVEMFGESPTIKVLDFFLTFGHFDYSKSQVASEVQVSRITIDPIWNKLIEEKFLIKTRTVGRAEMYKLNEENPKVKELLELNFKLSSVEVDEQIEGMKIAIKARNVDIKKTGK